MDRATSLIFADSKGKIVDDMVRTAPWYLEGEDEAREAVAAIWDRGHYHSTMAQQPLPRLKAHVAHLLVSLCSIKYDP
ncbi:uncharacterized protein L969DRAFT_89534 [Mixia osmundae IAM 14324]|uniref:uncharacterized protein n=1 Tax=Mixia osmundae (strain CBS 9802 / IAM 14324 / JCM 22182 / KY 12970) TaxID=764103 RepID=UPI0004A54A28|nr:uncharacterized protein L969DRAFT_89534 [Mixia osmundae IAM 14324]KEI37581.1 hypothetical protein L969DRAFT_89534 [Mixia osmundae IAM 14324]